LRTVVRVQGVRPVPVLCLSLSPLIPLPCPVTPAAAFIQRFPFSCLPRCVAPPAPLLSPCEGGRTFAGRFRRGASGGDDIIVRKKKIRANGGARCGRAEKISYS